jgi:hypothetical protein
MSSKASNEFNTRHNDRVGKIREAAVAALKELDRLRSAGPVTKEALDAEVARIAREKLQPYGCDLVVHRMGDGVTRFLNQRASVMGENTIWSRASTILTMDRF